MSIFNSMRINSSGLTLERLKMDVISTNMANVNTTRTEDGGPYLKKEVVFTESMIEARNGVRNKHQGLRTTHGAHLRTPYQGSRDGGVKVVGVRENEEGLREVYDPDHPDSDENGYLFMPNVNMVDEMIDLISVQRTYEANVTALTTSKNILKKALEISKG